MESIRVHLGVEQGRKRTLREVEIPTEQAMLRVAAELHAKRLPAAIHLFGWRVCYMPPCLRETDPSYFDPIAGIFGEKFRPEPSFTSAVCVFGEGSETWRVCLLWSNGVDQPPVFIQERGLVLPLADVS